MINVNRMNPTMMMMNPSRLLSCSSYSLRSLHHKSTMITLIKSLNFFPLIIEMKNNQNRFFTNTSNIQFKDQDSRYKSDQYDKVLIIYYLLW